MANGLCAGIFFSLPILFISFPFIIGLLSSFIKIIKEYEKGVLFAFGKYVGTLTPGLNFVIPIYHRVIKVDLRIATVDVPKQEVITKDNVPVNINAVIYFRVKDPVRAVLNVEDYVYAVAKYGQTSLRNVTGDATLDDLLSERKKIAEQLREIVDEATDPWGIEVTAIELQDIELPETMKRTMAKQAEAEREKRATIIKASGEVVASENLVKAAKILYGVKGALHLRTLHSLNDISSDQSNKVVFMVPLELLRSLEEVD
ncbi:MAG: SPFH domain-containing protein [Candidatus Altiarchaeota archaeon]